MSSQEGKCFAGQAAIVTGGADGLGKAIVSMLLQNGAKVMIFDVVEDKTKTFVDELQSAGYNARGCKVDVSQEASVKQGFVEFLEFSDRLDIMVNCAGIIGPNGGNAVNSEAVTVEEFDRVCAVNLRGSFLMMKYSLIEMKKHNYGRILLIASISGKEGNAGMSSYSASKAGVIGLVKSAGKEYATSGITVNALAPAAVRTALIEAMNLKDMIDKIPMQRCCTLDEVASITKFIVSKEASFNTGFCFDLTGGRSTY